jgi:membrane glycosyltransferase
MESLNGPRGRVRLRRTLFFGLTFLTAGGATALMLDALQANGLTASELVGLMLFYCLFAWIAGACWTAIAGFVIRVAGKDPAGLDLASVRGRRLRCRTAIVMPVYNEDTQRVAAGLESTWSSLLREEDQAAFDLFVLSDTTDPAIAVAEEAMFRGLVSRYAAETRLHYRRRTDRSGHKTGNIAEFTRRWGSQYDLMIVLDADSIMTGNALVTLARLMEAHPQIGILQSLPLPAGHETLFGRIIQFGSRLQSPMLGSGLAFWQLGDSNYWGHNAILRLPAFIAHCELPRLSGRPPWGGAILSHDFVEAALMRRAGYEIRHLPELEGSWEEVPGNVIDYVARDRRWAQGNLQHMRLLTYPRLRFISRVHLVTGIMSYASSPMWLALLLLSSLLSIIETAKLPQYFLPGLRSLYPRWPEIRTGETGLLIVVTLAVLLLPKLLGALLVVTNHRSRRQFAGTARLCTSLLLEQAFSVLLAPTMMLFHAAFVIQTLLGKSVSWNAQPRGERGVTFPEAFRRQKWQLITGLVWGAVILEFAPSFFWWLTPVFAGLVCGIPLTVWTSRARPGRVARRWGLFLVPEETEPPCELRPLQPVHVELKPAPPSIGSCSIAPPQVDSPRRSG